MKKEISGLFLAPERFAASLQELRATESIFHVRLFHNTAEQTAQVLDAAAATSSITQLEIGELDTGGAEALEAFLCSATSACKPTTLHIQHVCSAAAASALGRGLASPQCAVQDLTLSGLTSDLLSEVLAPIAASPAAAQRITALHLPLCKVSEAAAAAIGALSQLQKLDSALDDAALAAALQLPQPHKRQPSMTELKLARSPLTAAGAATLAAYVAACSQLTHLLLPEVPLADAGAECLARALAHSGSLQHLDLSGCKIGAAGAAALAQAVGQHAGLQVLNLDDNPLGAQGAASLLSALSTQHPAPALKLHHLHLSACHIRGADLPAGLASLQLRAPLSWLSLGRNQLMDAGVNALLPMLCGAAADGGVVVPLQHLDLKENGVGEQGVSWVSLLLQAQPGLKELIVDGNRLHDGGAEALLAAALAHPALQTLRMDACRVTSPLVKAKVQEAVLTLAARHRRPSSEGRPASNRSSLDILNAAAARSGSTRHRVGTRFPPEVYQVMLQQQLAAGGGDSPTGMACSPQSEPAPVVRPGRRFPPEVYMRPVEDQEGSGGAGSHKHIRDMSEENDSGSSHKGRRVTGEGAAGCHPQQGYGGGSANLTDSHVAAMWGTAAPRLQQQAGAPSGRGSLESKSSDCSVSPCSSSALSSPSAWAAASHQKQHGLSSTHQQHPQAVATIHAKHPTGHHMPCGAAAVAAHHAHHLQYNNNVGSSGSGRRYRPLTEEQQRLFVDF